MYCDSERYRIQNNLALKRRALQHSVQVAFDDDEFDSDRERAFEGRALEHWVRFDNSLPRMQCSDLEWNAMDGSPCYFADRFAVSSPDSTFSV